MSPELANGLIEEHRQASSWTSRFLFKTCHGEQDLSPGTGPAAVQLCWLAGQPPRLPAGTSYLFDQDLYCGPLVENDLLKEISDALGEAFMYSRGHYVGKSFTDYRMVCSYSCCAVSYGVDNFPPNCFHKSGTLREPIKRRREKRKLATDRMPTSKLKKPKPSSRDKPSHASNSIDLKKRTMGLRAVSPSHTCGAVVHIRRYHKSGRWYLSTRTKLRHVNHTPLDPIYRRIPRNSLSLPEHELAQLLFDEGTSLDSITRVTNQLRKKKGLLGRLKKRTIKNMLLKTNWISNSFEGSNTIGALLRKHWITWQRWTYHTLPW